MRSGLAVFINRMILVAGMALVACQIASGAGKTDSVFNILNSEIGKREHYTNLKEGKIATIRKELHDTRDPGRRFDACLALFNEYRSYQSDSAYRYAVMLNDLSSTGNNPQGVAIANMSLMDYYTSVGFFKEATEIKERIRVEDLPARFLPLYYDLCDRYYQNMGGYVAGSATGLNARYERARLLVLDSLIAVTDPNSGAYHLAVLEREQIESPSPERALKERQRVLGRYDLTNHEKAIQYSILGRLSLGMGNREDAKYYLALSAIHDIRGDIKETTAAKMLAELLYSESEFDRAYSLIHMAFDDAAFYNSHIRKEETSTTMRRIEVDHHNILQDRIWRYGVVAVVIFLLLVVTLLLLSKIRKKKFEIEEANRALKEKSGEIEEANRALSRKTEEVDNVNRELHTVIDQLHEVTEIKDAYIMQSLYMNTDFVNRVEEKCLNVVRLLKEKKYDSIKFLPYEIGIKEERARIYESFDRAFLSLFPNFVSEFNSLFAPEDYPVEPDSKELPVDVRIFALMRLGISDPKEVAKYLNLSVKTVYVYRTRLKSKSIVEKGNFEERIMSIRKG